MQDPQPAEHRASRFRQGISDRFVLAALAALALASLIFVAFPRLDLAVTRLFYTPGSGFETRAALELLREAATLTEWMLALAVTLPLLAKLAFPEMRLLVPPRVTLFVLLAFALGPGLVVNGILKEFWGRARPRTLLEFGGDAVFSRAWAIAGECERNCSFVSGEAAGTFCLLAVAFIVGPRVRPYVIAAVLAFAAAVSTARLTVGAHFLSDIVIAWLLTLLVLVMLWRFLLVGLPQGFDPAVENALARAGRALRAIFSPAQRGG